jgi:hypothetical protein
MTLEIPALREVEIPELRKPKLLELERPSTNIITRGISQKCQIQASWTPRRKKARSA